ncbi:hypothetical protein [Marinobacter orientalis]|uniref:DUF4136 domain-containing protein n=1 Tax=Marinobacter orientalis TaxID=1928859 RepID=A0A7Y0RBE9_9GAMM|nr:hypothetical protein [Marinobacter orientalis]NMT63122.1 hypothetical protein [Marinobacter orientalis]TGX51778.1 hypothetical protein DIT72_07125 [Marinobacter orientalis]
MKNNVLVATCLTLIFGFATLAGCSSGPEVKSVKKASGVSEAPAHLLVLAISSSEENRAVMESALVSQLRNSDFKATGYGPSPALQWQDPQQLRQQVEERLQIEDADGVLTVSLVRKNRQVEHIPHHVVFNPVTVSYGPLASATYMEAIPVPDSYKETTAYILRTTLFDAASGDSIWQMFSSTVDPKSLGTAAKAYARVVAREINNSFDGSRH